MTELILGAGFAALILVLTFGFSDITRVLQDVAKAIREKEL